MNSLVLQKVVIPTMIMTLWFTYHRQALRLFAVFGAQRLQYMGWNKGADIAAQCRYLTH